MSIDPQIPSHINDIRKIWKRWTRHSRKTFPAALQNAQLDFLYASSVALSHGWHALHPDAFPEELCLELGERITTMYMETLPSEDPEFPTKTPEEIAARYAAEFAAKSGTDGKIREDIENAFNAILLDLFDVYLEFDSAVDAIPEQLALTVAPLTKTAKCSADLLPIWSELTTVRDRRAARALRVKDFVCGTVTGKNDDGVATIRVFPSGHVIQAHFSTDDPELEVGSSIGGVAVVCDDGWVEFLSYIADLSAPIDELASESVMLYAVLVGLYDQYKPSGPQWLSGSAALRAYCFVVQTLLHRISESAEFVDEGDDASSEAADESGDEDDIIDGDTSPDDGSTDRG